MCINMYFLYTVRLNLVFYMAIFAKRIRCKHLVLKMLWIISTSFYCIVFLFHFSALAFLIPSPVIMILFWLVFCQWCVVVYRKASRDMVKKNETIKQYVQTSLHVYYWQIALQWIKSCFYAKKKKKFAINVKWLRTT